MRFFSSIQRKKAAFFLRKKYCKLEENWWGPFQQELRVSSGPTGLCRTASGSAVVGHGPTKPTIFAYPVGLGVQIINRRYI